jgi:hypothetical protein
MWAGAEAKRWTRKLPPATFSHYRHRGLDRRVEDGDDAGGGPDAVLLNEDRIVIHLDGREQRAQPIAHGPVGRRAPAVQQAGLGQQEGAAAYRRGAPRQMSVVGDPANQLDRLILAAGSQLFRPAVPGLAEHAFDVDQIEQAARLEQHLCALANQPDSAARNTVVVAGGGFTGIETATELPAHLRVILGDDVPVRVIVVERNSQVGATLGDGNARPSSKPPANWAPGARCTPKAGNASRSWSAPRPRR